MHTNSKAVHPRLKKLDNSVENNIQVKLGESIYDNRHNKNVLP